MVKMKFTTKEVFNVTDGRLVGNMDVVYDILSQFAGGPVFTHQLPSVHDRLRKENPEWFVKACKQLDEIKQKVGDDFQTLMDYIDKNCANDYYEVEKTKN